MTPPAPQSEYPVFIKRGDARPEVEGLARALGTTPEEAGVHKTIYAAQADQTVAMVKQRDSPLAARLRAAGWLEPREPTDTTRS